MTEHPKLVGAAEAAEILGISRATVHRWVGEDKLTPAQKLPAQTGAYLFSEGAVLALRDELAAAKASA